MIFTCRFYIQISHIYFTEQVAQVDARYAALKSEYPNAVVTGSTWDAFLGAIEDDGSVGSLPVVKKEEGDTWICE
jgi:hypothetical protein